MNVLFLTLAQFNNIDDTGLYIDLLRKFRDEGHDVYVICPRERRFNKPTECISENGVNFLRVRIGNITKTNIIEKGISTVTVGNAFLRALKKYYKNIKFDLVLYPTPPITFENAIYYVKKRDKAKTYLLLKDIFPQNAVDLNMFSKKSVIYKYFRFKERRLYTLSDYIGCMSQANVKYLLENNPYISTKTVEICPNSINPLIIKNDENSVIEIKKKYNIPLGKTVFIYGGNLGKPQGIDFLIECLKAVNGIDQVHFVIVGSGTEFNKLKGFFSKEKPSNAQLFKQLPKDDYEKLVSSCDVGLIFLDRRFTIPNFPSRLLTYMQASMPVLAATDVNTDLGKIIEQGEFGLWCESSDSNKFVEKVQQLCNERLRENMGANARKFLEENYTINYSYEKIMSHFK